MYFTVYIRLLMLYSLHQASYTLQCTSGLIYLIEYTRLLICTVYYSTHQDSCTLQCISGLIYFTENTRPLLYHSANQASYTLQCTSGLIYITEYTMLLVDSRVSRFHIGPLRNG
jgi:hypothetical protein